MGNSSAMIIGPAYAFDSSVRSSLAWFDPGKFPSGLIRIVAMCGEKGFIPVVQTVVSDKLVAVYPDEDKWIEALQRHDCPIDFGESERHVRRALTQTVGGELVGNVRGIRMLDSKYCQPGRDIFRERPRFPAPRVIQGKRFKS